MLSDLSEKKMNQFFHQSSINIPEILFVKQTVLRGIFFKTALRRQFEQMYNILQAMGKKRSKN